MEYRRLTSIKSFLTLFLILMLTGCISIGPMTLRRDRYNYNLALGNSGRQELLLNIVRLRYNEGPVILKVGNISASAVLARGLSTANSAIFFPPNIGKVNTLSPQVSLSYNDNPIVSYTPLDDKEYTIRFLKSLSLSDIGLLLESSWSIGRVSRLTMQEVGNAPNATNAARATSSHMPEYKEFLNVITVLRRMQLENGYVLTYYKTGDEENLILNVKKNYRFTPKEIRVLHKSGIEIYQNKITFSNRIAPHKVYVVTRSVLGVSNYLSKSLPPPRADIERGVVTLTYDNNGRVFDWNRVLVGIMRIYCSDKYPQDASIAIPYRDKWYYIKDSDNDSKETIVLVQNIVGLISTSPVGSTATVGLTRNV